MKNFYRCAHRANHAAADDSLRQLEMMKAEEVHALVKIEKAFRHIVQAKEFLMSSIKVVDAEPRLQQLSVEGIAQARSNVEKG